MQNGAMPSSELVFHVVVLEMLAGAGLELSRGSELIRGGAGKVMAAVGKKRQRGGGEIEGKRNSGGRG